MKKNKIKDIKLAGQGKLKIEWAEKHMPVLMQLKEMFERKKTFKDWRVATCLHITKESAVLLKPLAAGGATVAITACNPLSTQDDIAASLALEGFYVYGWRGLNNNEYYENIEITLDLKPDITIDDACDLIFTAHTKRQELLPNIKGGCEETTSGVKRLKIMGIFNSHRQSDQTIKNSALFSLLCRNYFMGHAGRMIYQTFNSSETD